MKRLIRLTICILIISSCQDIERPKPTTKSEGGVSIESISPYSDNNLIEALSKLGSENGRISSSFGGINMDSVLKVLNYGSGITNYSILLESNPSSSAELYFDNLIDIYGKIKPFQLFLVQFYPRRVLLALLLLLFDVITYS